MPLDIPRGHTKIDVKKRPNDTAYFLPYIFPSEGTSDPCDRQRFHLPLNLQEIDVSA
jgi:hypothetical protein